MRLQRRRAAHDGVTAVKRNRRNASQARTDGRSGCDSWILRQVELRSKRTLQLRAQLAEFGERESTDSELCAQSAQHSPSGTRIARQLRAGREGLHGAVDVHIAAVDLGRQADR